MISAAAKISLKGISKYSTIMNAAAPKIGGVIWPPVEDAASTAPEKCEGYPTFFMAGIVKDPVVTVLAIDDPEIVPIKADEKIATLAGPPENFPAINIDKSINSFPNPTLVAKTPNNMNKKTY